MRDAFHVLTSSRMMSGDAVEVAEAAFAHLSDRAVLLVIDERRSYSPSWSPDVARAMLTVLRSVRSGVPINDGDRGMVDTEIDRLDRWIRGREGLDDGPLVFWDGDGIDLGEGRGHEGARREECWVLMSSKMAVDDAVEAAKLACAHLPPRASLSVIDGRKIYAPRIPLELAHRTLEVFRRIRDGVPVPEGERFIIEAEIDELECHSEEFEAGGEGEVVVWSSS